MFCKKAKAHKQNLGNIRTSARMRNVNGSEKTEACDITRASARVIINTVQKITFRIMQAVNFFLQKFKVQT